MKITNEIKAKVFAQYFGQVVLTSETIRSLKPVSEYTLKCIQEGAFRSSTLVLKPLSAITDKDAADYCNKFLLNEGSQENKIALSKEEIKNNLSPGSQFVADEYQFLQSRGYDLPHYLLNNQTLKEAGLAVYE